MHGVTMKFIEIHPIFWTSCIVKNIENSNNTGQWRCLDTRATRKKNFNGVVKRSTWSCLGITMQEEVIVQRWITLCNKFLVTNYFWGKISHFLLISWRWVGIWQWNWLRFLRNPQTFIIYLRNMSSKAIPLQAWSALSVPGGWGSQI